MHPSETKRHWEWLCRYTVYSKNVYRKTWLFFSHQNGTMGRTHWCNKHVSLDNTGNPGEYSSVHFPSKNFWNFSVLNGVLSFMRFPIVVNLEKSWWHFLIFRGWRLITFPVDVAKNAYQVRHPSPRATSVCSYPTRTQTKYLTDPVKIQKCCCISCTRPLRILELIGLRS